MEEKSYLAGLSPEERKFVEDYVSGELKEDKPKFDGKLKPEELQKLRDALVSERKIRRIEYYLDKYKDSLSGFSDLVGDAGVPSDIFFTNMELFGYLLDNDPDKTVSKAGVLARRAIHPPIAKKSPEFLMNPHVIENRKFLMSEETDISKVPEDDPVILPKESVIWIQNHGFKDDALSSVASIPRHTYLFFGSLPQFYNSVYGISASLGGVVIINRKSSASKAASVPKGAKVLNCGADLLICPEATYCKTPELLQLDYWSGFYQIAKEAGKKYVVPIVHYLRDPFERTNPIHTVIDDPIDISKYSEKEAKQIVRDRMATWYYLMLEKYGKTTREELLGNKDYDEAWKDFVKGLLSDVDYYDTSIETTCDFRDRSIIRPEEAFKNIANIEKITPNNAYHVAYASNLVRTRKKRDFQRLY